MERNSCMGSEDIEGRAQETNSACVGIPTGTARQVYTSKNIVALLYVGARYSISISVLQGATAVLYTSTERRASLIVAGWNDTRSDSSYIRRICKHYLKWVSLGT